jgi:subtilisin family serine protease
MTNTGITVVAAAGNNNQDVLFYSPGRSSYAITVASSDIHDSFTSSSNFGFAIDVIAPGIFYLLSHSLLRISF